MKMASTSDMILAETESFHKKYLGTNNESAVDCIIHTPIQIQASVIRNDLNIQWVSTLEKKRGLFYSNLDH